MLVCVSIKHSRQGRREGGYWGGGRGTPPKIGRFRIFGKLDARLDVYSEIKKYVYISHMNEKMAAFKYIVQCYKCNCLAIKENRENSYFPNDKTCHYAENMSLFGQFGQRSKAVV